MCSRPKLRIQMRQSELVAKTWRRAERLDNLGNFYFDTIALFMYCNIEQMNISRALELFKQLHPLPCRVTSLYKLYRYGPPQGVWVLNHFGLEISTFARTILV